MTKQGCAGKGMDPNPHSSTWDDFVGAALLSGWDEPLVSMPWEQGFAGLVLGGKGLTTPMAMPRPGPAPPVVAASSGITKVQEVRGSWDIADLLADASGVGAAFLIVAKRSSRSKGPKQDDRDSRSVALQGWADITEVYADQCRLGKQIKGLGKADAVQVVADTFEDKATATLVKRASAIRLFMAWCSVNRVPYSPLDENKVYAYVGYMRDHGLPATRATSFVEALGFAMGLLGLDGVSDILSSRRVKGAALASFKRKRLTTKRAPLTVSMVSDLEHMAGDGIAENNLDSLMAGFCCFVLHGRMRLADAARITKEPEVDVGSTSSVRDPRTKIEEEFGHGYFETVAADAKTGNLKRRRRVGLPVAGFAFGLNQLPWAQAWLKKREELGLDAAKDGCLMLAPLASGELSQSRLNASEASAWLKRLLANAGHSDEELDKMGSHSLKATVLSWAAKAGLGGGVRRILGAHAKPKDNSMLEYSRDALAGPLSQVDALYESIRSGAFDPDNSRSGYWSAAKGSQELMGKIRLARWAAAEPHEEVQVDAENPCNSCLKELGGAGAACACCKKMVHAEEPCLTKCPDCGLAFCVECELGPLHGCGGADSAGSGSDTSDDTADDTEDEAVEATRMESFREAEEGAADGDAPEGLVRDGKTRQFHRQIMMDGAGSERCRCGAAVGDGWAAVAQWPKVRGSVCSECF